MKNRISYDWVIEFVKIWEPEVEDIVDAEYYDRYSDIVRESAEDYDRIDIALVRYSGNDEDGEHERGYAYIKNSVLASEFDSGHKVPARYKAQIK